MPVSARLLPWSVVVAVLSLSSLLLVAPTQAGDAPGTMKDYKGEVVPLAEVLSKKGVHLDADASPNWLGLVTAEGDVYPLVKDDGARLFFKDKRLLHRPMLLTGRVLPGVGMLQVVQVHSYVKGQLCEVFYWCDVCSIRRSEDGKCDCCGGPRTLREEPVEK